MWKCSCGCIFTDDEAGTYQECVGEFWGAPAYETFMCCPSCGGDEFDEYYEEEEEEESENEDGTE